MSDRDQPLLAWQYAGYPTYHAARLTLLVHLVTVPLFHLGLWMLLLSPWVGARYALLGLLALLIPAIAQGATHRREAVPPAPFTSRSDVLVRLVAEQLVTFPRFLLSGGFWRAWRAR